MSKKIIILSSFLIVLFSGSISAQTSPFDKSANVEPQELREGFVTKRQMQRYIDDLRMELEFIVMQNSPSLNDIPEPNSSFLGDLGDDAKLKVIINGKELKRDSEKYSINNN
jgi:hypothetical protein